MKKFIAEFKEFAIKGNAIALAVGIIIGAAFSSVVNSLANDIIMPVVGIFFKTDLSEMTWTINGSTILYGTFLSAILNFLILALVVFILVRLYTKFTETAQKTVMVISSAVSASADESTKPNNQTEKV